MKNIIIGLLTLSSVSAFAGDCTVALDIEHVSISKRALKRAILDKGYTLGDAHSSNYGIKYVRVMKYGQDAFGNGTGPHLLGYYAQLFKDGAEISETSSFALGQDLVVNTADLLPNPCH